MLKSMHVGIYLQLQCIIKEYRETVTPGTMTKKSHKKVDLLFFILRIPCKLSTRFACTGGEEIFKLMEDKL